MMNNPAIAFKLGMHVHEKDEVWIRGTLHVHKPIYSLDTDTMHVVQHTS